LSKFAPQNQTKNNTIMKLRNLFILGMASSLVLASCGGKEKPKPSTTDTTKADTTKVDTTANVPTVVNIVETAKTDTNLSMLVELLGTAGLAETLADENAKFTVFAPTNAAFLKLGDKKLASLKEEKNKEMLKDILLYHVVSGDMLAADVTTKTELNAMDEKVIKVTSKDSKWMVAGATITTTDIKCSNGTVHVIDAVMTPPAKKSKAKTDAPVTTTEVNKNDVKTNNAVVTETKKGK
jgi:uncharacterized surface protein with fasciclin (FAS1) repeats